MLDELDKVIDDALFQATEEWFSDPLNSIKEQVILGQSSAAHVSVLEDEELEWMEEEARCPRYYSDPDYPNPELNQSLDPDY